jgi:hypothetical protein
MIFWQRLVLTVLAMILASLIAAELWRWAFSFELPSYASGVAGGLAAVPVWELCKRMRTKR